jgi:hypothetical protein
MASNAGPSTKKRDRTKDRQKRKDKRKKQPEPPAELFKEFNSGSEGDVSPDTIYGIRGETKREWDARVGNQPASDASWGAYQRRAKQRHGKSIEYVPPVIPDDQVLRIDAMNGLDEKELTGEKTVLQLLFAPGMTLDE